MAEIVRLNTVVVGLGFKARSGKDTAAAAIIKARSADFDVRRYAFADALKREVNAAANEAGGMFALFNDLQVRGAGLPNGKRIQLPEWVKYDPNPDMSDPLCPLGRQRTLLQWWGTEYRRAVNPFYWVLALEQVVFQERPQFALITDMRFLNEFLWVKHKMSGHTIRFDRVGFSDVNVNPTHASETELERAAFDYTIVAEDGNVSELASDAVTVFDMIVGQERGKAGAEWEQAA